MKLDPNMEIDRLLRRQARRGAASSISSAQDEESGNGGGAAERELEDGAHLDADEMNAYAENALPAAARARYMAHLADCDSCRKVVTELVMASGVANELEKQAVAAVPQTSAPARSWLATLFAPHILRYAASVILVVGLVAIAFIVFRGREARFSSQEEQARNEPVNTQANSQSNQNQQLKTDRESGSATAPAQQNVPAKPDGTGVVAPLAGTPESKDAPADASKTTTTVTAAKGPDNDFVLDGVDTDQKEARRDEDQAGLARQQQASPPPPAPVLEKDKNKQEAATADSTFGADVASSNRRESDREVTAKGGAATESKAPASRGNEEQPSTRKRAGGRAASPPKESLAGAVNDDRVERKDMAANKAEATRSVGGRRFVRRGDAWVDTAYQSQATTNIKRGSEQYRALVADEPGLRSIADQLGGEVVVVWKGRAYRIR